MGETIKVTVEGTTKEYDKGVCIFDIAKDYQKNYEHEIVLSRTNGRLRELSKTLKTDTELEFITGASKLGIDTYRRSVPLVMLKAFNDVYGKEHGKKIYISYSLSKGLFCRMSDNTPFTDDLVEKVKKRMMEIVEEDLPITKTSINTQNAIELFKSFNMTDKEKLLSFRRVSKTNIYKLGNYTDYYFGFMVPRTGMLKYFDLFRYADGFVLQMPTADAPEKIPPFNPQHKIFAALKEAEIWAEKMEASCVGDLNNHIVEGDIVDLVYVQEALFERKVVEIVDQFASKRTAKIIMIAGPTSSGKTTFSHRLTIQLKAAGYKPHLIGVDNYFVNREDTPLDEEGNYDYECLEAIDIKKLNEDLMDILAGKRVEIPTFNFVLGKREYNNKYIQLSGENDIIVMEGIHCLNDELTYSLPIDKKFKIYISALTQLNVDEHNRIATTDGRLLRRIARDARTRGIDAQGTIGRWKAVRAGEEKHIFPYQEQADVVINSAMIYEISALKQCVEPLLFKVPMGSPEYDEAKRLLKFLDYFLPLDSRYIPDNSIVREFIGDGCFDI